MISLSASVVLADTITGTGWKGTAGNNNWSSTGNWDSAAPNTVGTGDRNLFFGQGWHNAGRTGATTANNDLTNWAGYRITFENISGGANQSFSLTGNGFTLFDFGGGYPRIENDSSVLQTINLSGTLTLSGTGGGGYAEVNPVGGDLTISNAVDLAGTTQLRVWGNNGRTLTVGAISSTGNSGNNSFVLKQNSTVIFKGANTYAGSTALDAGTVRVDVAPTGSGITSSYFVGNGGTTGTSATLLLGGGAGGASGGITFGNAVSANLGSGGNRTIGGSNTTGTNTFIGTVTLNDSNATLVAATGGTVAFNTITAASVQTVAIGGGSNNGTVQFGGTGDNVNVAATVNTGSLLLAKTSSASVHAVGGGLTVNAGATAQLAGTGGDQIFNSSSVTVNNGGAFDANDRSETITNLSLAGTGISGGGALLNSGTGSATIAPSGSTTLAAATTIGVANSAASLALSGKVTGGGTLTKTGAGLLTLNGSTSDYSGATTLAGGILNSGATAALGTGNITFTGGTLQYGAGSAASDYASRIKNSTSTVTLDTNGQSVTLGGVIDGSNTSGLTKIGAGTLTLQGDNSYGGATTISGGMLVQDRNGGSIPDTSAVILANTTGAILHLNHNETIGSLSGGGGSGGNVELVNRHLTTGDGANTSYGGVISGNATSELIKQGSGLFTLTNANTYDGLTTVSQGTLEVTSNNALGSFVGGTIVGSGAALVLNNVNYSTAEPLTINGSGISNGGALANAPGGTSTFAGQITAASNATIHDGGLGSVLNLTGGIVKNGTTLTLTGGGQTNISNLGISGAAANSDLVVDGTIVVTTAASTYNGPTSIQNFATFVANNTSGSATGTGNVTVDSTSTLGGTGAVAVGTGSFIYVGGSLVVGDPTLISPAASSLTLNTSGGGSTVLGALSTVYVDIFSGDGLGDNTSLASAADYVKLFGALDNTLGGTLTIGNPNSLSGFASGDSWKLFDLGSPTPTGSILGTFVLDYSSLGLGPTLAGSFDNTTGVFSIYTVPEPSRAVLILSGALLGFVRRRRRA
ncbi:MAG: autotransporter-associated beta strand repeat-containing protein [Verrucomicrobiaceae bacterium]|nr:autotransporter-associated beta strand repeat-containing protein [Verrucomicrobiaceae bacterium]